MEKNKNVTIAITSYKQRNWKNKQRTDKHRHSILHTNKKLGQIKDIGIESSPQYGGPSTGRGNWAED